MGSDTHTTRPDGPESGSSLGTIDINIRVRVHIQIWSCWYRTLTRTHYFNDFYDFFGGSGSYVYVLFL
jgi:hypothetical protein